jgi:hypothetical protein
MLGDNDVLGPNGPAIYRYEHWSLGQCTAMGQVTRVKGNFERQNRGRIG